MKISAFSKGLLLASTLVVALLSCNKHDVLNKKNFAAKIKTFYRVAPKENVVPVEINGVVYAGFANFPGGGDGTASHLGNCTYYFNQLVYGSAPDAPPAGSVNAPLIDVPGYVVTGAPLPLIQNGDFTKLAGLINSLKIPGSTYDQIINAAFTNKKGEAIFTSALAGTGGTFPVSATVIGFNGKAIIIGGRGRFKKAVGEIDYDGTFDVTNANVASYNAKGWISY